MAGAGIMVTLCGVRVEGAKWKFFLDRDEGTMADFLDEEDADLLPKLRTKSEYVEEFVSSEGAGFGYSALKCGHIPFCWWRLGGGGANQAAEITTKRK